MTDKRWNQVETLFRQALEREPHDRGTFLGEVCVGDEALRREVESLLAHSENAGSFLESGQGLASPGNDERVRRLIRETL